MRLVHYIQNVAPLSGPITGGTLVTITSSGNNYRYSSSATYYVRFGSSDYEVQTTRLSNTQIQVTTPGHSFGSVDVSVVPHSGTDWINLETKPSAFYYEGSDPASGTAAGGTSVTIHVYGNTFDAGHTYTVLFGGVSVPGTRVDGYTLTATTPEHDAGVVTVVVKRDSSPILTFTNGFTYIAIPLTVTATGVNKDYDDSDRCNSNPFN